MYNLGKPNEICYTRLSAEILHLAKIQAILVFFFAFLCIIAFSAGLAFMSGRRVYKPLSLEQNSANQMSGIGGTSAIGTGLGGQVTSTPFANSILRETRGNAYSIK